MAKLLSKSQRDRIEREKKVFDNADFFNVVIFQMGRWVGLPSFEEAKARAAELVVSEDNKWHKPAMIYAVQNQFDQFVLVGNLYANGTWHQVLGT